MTTRDIHDQLQDLYGIELSAEMVSKITDKIIPDIREWQSRPLDPVYPFVFMDAIHYKIREDGRILNRAAYVVLGIGLDGTKDGLTGFKEAILAVYPDSEVQRCIIHMLRNSFKYVSYKDLKKFSSDFKAVYKAPTEEVALSELEGVKEDWGKKYPNAISNWEQNWDVIRPFFQFSEEIRRIMYTTNIIEALNRQFRKVTKTKSVFPNDTSLEKMLYLATHNVRRKWTMRYRNWDLVLSQLTILYGERINEYL